MSKNKLIFIHIPKTGGSTLHQIIGRQYNSRSILNVKNSREADQFKALPLKEKHKTKVLKGHMAFGYHKAFSTPDTVGYITMLRHPIDRVISNYYFILNRKNHHTHTKLIANNYSLKDYVTSGVIANAENAQVRLLSNNIYAPHGECTPKMLGQAKENLDRYFSVVGINSMFDASVLLMKNELNWQIPLYTRENVAKQKILRSDIDEETLQVIKKYNALDIELFEWATLRLEKQIAAEGPAFQKQLHRFKKANQIFQKVATIKNSLFQRKK